MAQTQRLGTAHTTHTMHDGVLRVQYHQTEVVTASPCTITLRTGGWKTNTTRTRMNQASNQFGLGFSVYQKDFDWYVDYRGDTHRFAGDTLELERP